jgi:hypothetical protein
LSEMVVPLAVESSAVKERFWVFAIKAGSWSYHQGVCYQGVCHQAECHQACACGSGARGGSRLVREGKLVREDRASRLRGRHRQGSGFLPSRRVLGCTIMACTIRAFTIKLRLWRRRAWRGYARKGR